ncbi:101 kDa heat shock protein [Medicago truncatula]|uniref:101 kDa heat shock protein n=1 Tax=Medicago truncatula TaxID=3880 RepID=A0A072UDL0_MEDTR|nr:101 kDa heat shock protein [Medicago truncatula]
MLTETVGPDHIAKVVSRWTGTPVTRLVQNDKERLVGLGDKLHSRVVGQDQAVKVFAGAVVRSRVGLRRPQKPTDSTCRNTWKKTLSRLIGAPPGYTVIIMTSNLGAEHLISGLSGKCTMQVARDRVMQEVKKHFRPELLNSLDEVVVFDHLSHDYRSSTRLDYILAESYDPVYGARPIRRWLEKNVVSELAMMYIKEKIDENTTVYIDVGPKGSDLSYRVEKNGEIVNAETGVKSDILIQIPT